MNVHCIRIQGELNFSLLALDLALEQSQTQGNPHPTYGQVHGPKIGFVLLRPTSTFHHSIEDCSLRIQPSGIFGTTHDDRIGVGQIRWPMGQLPRAHHDVVYGMHVRRAVFQDDVKPLVVDVTVRHACHLLDTALL